MKEEIKESTLALMKLLTGEEILATMRKSKDPDTNQDSIELNFPALAIMDEEGRYRLRPWLFVTENIDKEAWIPINPLMVAICGTPVADLAHIYEELKQKVCSPVIVPTSEQTATFSKPNAGSNLIH